jgi:hypothetical protein
MGNPRIVYDGTTLDFPQPASVGSEVRRPPTRDLEFSHGKKHSGALRNLYDRGRLLVDKFTDAEFERKLVAWWSWAARLNTYAVAIDSADIVDTTLNASANAGATTIQLTSTTGIVVGSRYNIREAAGQEEEAVEVQSINAGVSVVITAGLKYGYVSGDIFRSRNYIPLAVSLDNDDPVELATATGWTFDHHYREVL